MENSLFSKLPPELRQMVYKQCIGGDFREFGQHRKIPLGLQHVIYTVGFRGDSRAMIYGVNRLAILQLCSSIRKEAIKSLMRDVVVFLAPRYSDNNAMTVLTPQECQAVSLWIGTIPAHIPSDKLEFRLQHDCRLVIDPNDHFDFPWLNAPLFTANTRLLVAAVRPRDVVMSVNFTFHALSKLPYNKSYHEPLPGRLWIVCSRDESMMSQACENILINFTALDKTKAQKSVNDAFAKRRRQFEAHRGHRMCFIKLSGIDKALAALTKAHDMTNEMISLL
jgi:hypothetical protein